MDLVEHLVHILIDVHGASGGQLVIAESSCLDAHTRQVGGTSSVDVPDTVADDQSKMRVDAAHLQCNLEQVRTGLDSLTSSFVVFASIAAPAPRTRRAQSSSS